MVGFFRVGYDSGVEGYFIPRRGHWDIEVHGDKGRAVVWDNGLHASVRLCGRDSDDVREHTIRAIDESPTVLTIRDIIRELETGERTSGNIDVTMQTVEAQFGIAHSHLSGGTPGLTASGRPLAVRSRRLAAQLVDVEARPADALVGHLVAALVEQTHVAVAQVAQVRVGGGSGVHHEAARPGASAVVAASHG